MRRATARRRAARQPLGTRDMLARATRDAHEALHRHPVLARLTDPQVSADCYHVILTRYAAFYGQAEACRAALDVCPTLSLRDDVARLNRDTGPLPWAEVPLALDHPTLVLGMLYVLHGAKFGASVIHRNLRCAFPDRPHHFFGARPQPARWQDLIAALERVTDPTDRAMVIEGAARTFATFDRWMATARPELTMTAERSIRS